MAREHRKHNRLRRARKDWEKGNRRSIRRLDVEDDTQSEKEPMRPRAVAIDDVGDVEELPRGQVVETMSGRYDVQLDRTDVRLSCRVKRGASTENDRSTLVVIGDFVRVQPLEDARGLIHHIEQRRTRLGREVSVRAGTEQVVAANVDLLLCLAAADRADFRRTIIDRYIVAALLGEVRPIVVVNKMDLVDEEIAEELEHEFGLYRELGYETFFISAKTEDGVEDLRAAIASSTSVLVGQSGVGKSSITNTILGYEARRTAEVRARDRRGIHTTIGSVMLPLAEGGMLIDTPGLREFGIWDLKPEELDGYFIEFLDYLQECKYLPCTHTHEPGCAVIEAVENEKIDVGRYMSYLAIFESLEQKNDGARP